MRERILALLIDFLIIMSICLIPLIIYSIVTGIEAMNSYISTVTLLILLKDLPFKNASIGKKIMKIEVRKTNNQIPSIFIIIIRNITVCIWLLECILLLMNKKRIGDWICDTKVVESKKKK